MSNSQQVRQDKLRRMAFLPEAALGTFGTPSGSWFTIPGYELKTVADRGTKIIQRANNMDGYPGGARGVPGSFGNSVGFVSEIHSIPDTAIPYWVILLLACGCEATAAGGAYTIKPTTKPARNWTQAAQGWSGATPDPYVDSLLPIGISTMEIYNDNAEADYSIDSAGNTGSFKLSLVSGERMTLTCMLKGLVANGLINVSDTDLANVGAFQSGVGIPVVVTGITISLVNDVAADAIGVVSKLEIDLGANVADVPDPTKADGFAVSPVLIDASPTVAFQLADNRTNDSLILPGLKAGTLFTMVIDLTATDYTIQVNLPTMQFTGVNFEPVNGWSNYAIEADCVRPQQSATAPFNIVVTPV